MTTRSFDDAALADRCSLSRQHARVRGGARHVRAAARGRPARTGRAVAASAARRIARDTARAGDRPARRRRPDRGAGRHDRTARGVRPVTALRRAHGCCARTFFSSAVVERSCSNGIASARPPQPRTSADSGSASMS
ncbi:hypothetical protein BCPG_01851 [Burkholderia cenocepacia PC184]|nr:hypothetical protein BCPG_01851 [Burkholderia cenocepacia PC184]